MEKSTTPYTGIHTDNFTIQYDYTLSLYMAMVTIRVMDAIKEEFPEAYPEKKLCLAGGWGNDTAGVSLMNLTRSGHLENEKISNTKNWMA
ncbi:MAG: hypothetical protein PHU97_09050 [Bacteroidales bacterium]|nr:hypothetical protein [Bacteroidales bacterium]MDD3011449.1 hypothetical protein [Bacteroidales bacterium]MDD3961845.1 hypothetical protein [Bacteroidales bacterium]MDY0285927.1 hypothetical protein [Bacteroidales bacterium]HPE87055.1 hypothetical protein [Bacteroidales bacterium]